MSASASARSWKELICSVNLLFFSLLSLAASLLSLVVVLALLALLVLGGLLPRLFLLRRRRALGGCLGGR